ncbi:LysE family translocator [Inquilinus sp. OTU3971]|uniref:LysE family translocator n=1 Tax=Inquilinus sp. OTU3971 TaxID=3043855 RepID=UPI00313B7B39
MDILPTLPLLIGFVAASAVLAITPGPDMAFFLGRTARGGRRLGFLALLGALTGLLCHALMAALGLSTLLASSAAAFMTLKIVGCGYLLWLGLQAIRHGTTLPTTGPDNGGNSALRTYLGGVAINLLNPKIVMFFLTFLPQFVGPDDPQASGKMLFLSLLFIAVGALVCGVIIFSAERFMAACRTNRRVTRALDYVFAGLMGLFAGKLLLSTSR